MYPRTHHLSHLLLRGVLLVTGGASVLLGLLFLGLYRNQLVHERAEVSLQLNRMLQVTWENAMLKRDIDGLRDIVGKIGKLKGIRDVLLLASQRRSALRLRPNQTWPADARDRSCHDGRHTGKPFRATGVRQRGVALDQSGSQPDCLRVLPWRCGCPSGQRHHDHRLRRRANPRQRLP